METLLSILYVIAGFVLRLAIPIVGTIMVVLILRKLDARWQTEAASQPVPGEKPDCWKIRGGENKSAEDHPVAESSLPCWQVYRLPNGYLNEECISCKVFTEAPVPALHVEPRRL
jgi:hypothetical protein